MKLSIEPLSRLHAREEFDCGSEPLNAYLRQTARQHAERGISRTFVLVGAPVRPVAILGYFTLNLCQVQPDWLPETYARKFPREIAAIKLGRLAVDRQHHGKGYGGLLLAEAMKRVLEVFETAGGIGLFVDAKDEAAARFYQRFGFEPLPQNPLQLFLPLATIRQAVNSAG